VFPRQPPRPRVRDPFFPHAIQRPSNSSRLTPSERRVALRPPSDRADRCLSANEGSGRGWRGLPPSGCDGGRGGWRHHGEWAEREAVRHGSVPGCQ
jgi:hypothetical protein